MSYFRSTVLLDEAAWTDITRTLTRDWFYQRALHTGGWRVSVSPTLVESDSMNRVLFEDKKAITIPRCANASAIGLQGYVDHTLPSRCYASPWSCVCVWNFEITTFPTVASEPRFYALMLCTSRTQVCCGWYKSYCLPACHTLVRRYCWMKRPGPTLHVRLREISSTDVLCTQVAGGWQFLQI